MLKRILVAMAGVFVVLGLALAPANGAQSQLDMYSEIGEAGAHEFVFAVPTACTATPLSEVKSARNTTSTVAEFYQTSDCSEESPLAVVETDGELENIVDAQGNGAIAFKAAE